MKHLLITTALITAPLPVFAQTAQEDEDKGFLTNLIEENLSGAGREVNITGFKGALSSAATIERLTIADSEGIWLDLENVVLDWNRAALLRGRIEVEELSAERIAVTRAPIAEATIDVPAAEATPFSLPELPVSIELGTLQIDRIELGESFVGEPVNISLTGSASLAGGEGEANVTATRLDDITGEFIINGSYSNDTQDLLLKLDISEGADGLAAKKLGIPGQPAIALTIDGEGPISTFAANIALATDGQDRIAGNVALLDNDGQQGFEVDIRGDVSPLLEGDYQDFFGDDLSLTAAGQKLEDGRFDFSAFELQAQRLVLSGGAMIGAEGWPERISVIGRVADPSGDIILLPLAGPETFVNDVRLNVTYDQTVSENWEAVFNVSGYDRPGLYIETLALIGGGIIRPGEGEIQVGEWTADFDYAANGLELDDPGTAEVFGDVISGDIVVSRTEEDPTQIESITVRGPGLEASVTGEIDTSDGLKITSDIALQVSALERFSTLAGRDLGGAVDLTVTSAIDPLNQLYDIQVNGTTDTLAVAIPQVDPLLTGAGDIAIDFQRDTEGTRLETFDITTTAASITANANLTSESSDATFTAQINDANDIESSLNGPVTLVGTANQNGAKIVAFNVSGTLPDATITATGTAAPLEKGYNVLANIAANIADLETYATIAGRPLDGAANATLSGILLTEGLRFTGDFSAETTDVQVGLEQLDPLLAGTGTVSVQLQRNTDTQYRVDQLALRTPQVRLDADADVDLVGPIDATFDLDLTDVGLLQPELSGPLAAQGSVSRGDDTVATIDITATAPGLNLDADVDVDTATYAGSGDVKAQIDELSDYASLIGQPLSGGVTADVSGDFVPDFSNFDLTVDVTTRDLQTGIAQADALLAGAGRLQGSAERNANGVNIPSLVLSTPQVNLNATLDQSGTIGNGVFDLRVNDVSLVVPEISGPLTANGTVTQGTDGIAAINAIANAPGISVTADVDVAPETYAVSGDVMAQVDELANYESMIGRPVSGGITADASGRFLPDFSDFDLALDVTTRNIQSGIAQVDPLIAGTGRIQANAQRDEDGIRVPSLTLTTPETSLTGSFQQDETLGDGTFDLRINDLSLVVPEISGPLTANGTVSQRNDGVATIDATANAPGIAVTADVNVAPETQSVSGDITAEIDELADYQSLIGQPVSGSVRADASGRFLPDFSDFNLVVDVVTRNVQTGIAQLDPLLAGNGRIAANAQRDDQGLRVPSLTLTTPQADLQAAFNQSETHGNGTFDLTINNIGVIANNVSGQATATGRATQNGDGDWAVTANVTAPQVNVDADVTRAANGELAGTVQAAISNLASYRGLIGQPVSGGVNATVTGSLVPDLSTFNADINVATRDIGVGNPTVDQLLSGAGTIGMQASRTSDGIRVSDLNAQTGNVSLTGDLNASGNGTSTGQFNARLRDVGLFTDQLSGPVTADGTASLSANGTIGLDVTAQGPGGIVITANGDVASGGNLNIDVGGQVPLALANNAIEPRRVDGTATLDLALNGPAGLNAVSGQVLINNARLAAPTLSQALENINGSIGLNNGTAQIDIRSNVSQGGSINLAGQVALNGAQQANLNVTVDDVTVRDPELYETSIDGQIGINGPLSGGALIAGVLTLDETDIQVPSSGVGSLGDLPDVVHVGQSNPVQQTLDKAGVTDVEDDAASGPVGPGFPLDITINAPSRIFIRGRGLDAELGGTLNLGGTTNNIIPVGQFSLTRGRLDILQQRFELTEGVATLQGDFSPFIRLVAETEARTGTKIRIIVEGPADEPEVTFESTPDLPQDEVLSQLIFGRDLSEISPLQAVQLAAAVGTLAGRGGGGLIDGFRQNLGLDDFDVTTDDDGNAAVRAGAYLSENVYTDVTINSVGETEINLNLDITSEITAKGTATATGDTSIGVFFERDY